MAVLNVTQRGRSWFDRMVDTLALIAGVLLCILTLLVCFDVLSRTLRLFAMPWTLDVTEYMLYAITFLAAPWVLREQGHIAIEIVVERLPRGLRRLVQRVADAIGALVCGVLFVFSCRVLWRSWTQNNLVHETFVFPEWYLFVLAPPVFLILTWQFIARTARSAGERDGARRQSV